MARFLLRLGTRVGPLLGLLGPEGFPSRDGAHPTGTPAEPSDTARSGITARTRPALTVR